MKLFIVIEGGCVRYVASNSQEIEVEVIDLDDLSDEPDEERQALLDLAEKLPRVW
jgi:hypothetical protein